MSTDAAVNDIAELLLADLEADFKVKHMLGIAAVNIAEILRDRLVIDNPPDRCIDNPFYFNTVNRLYHTKPNRCMESYNAFIVGHNSFTAVAIAMDRAISAGSSSFPCSLLVRFIDLVTVCQHTCFQPCVTGIFYDKLFSALFCTPDSDHRKIIGAEDHILCRNRNRVPVLRTQQVIRRKHQDSGFCLRLCRKRQVNCHLVTVKVCIVCGADKRMQSECASFHQHRFKSLNTEAVKRRCTVEQHRVLFDHIFQSIPDFRSLLVYHLLG